MGGSKMLNLQQTVSTLMKTTNQHEQRMRWMSPREEAINRCLSSLIHTLSCREGATCRTHGCRKMKIVVEHTKTCPRKASSFRGCVICTQLMNLCFYHSRQCRQSVCHVPFCRIMKKKLQAMNEHHALKQSIQSMKPVYQFPIPPLRPFSSTSTPLNAADDRNEVSNEPLPKRRRTESEANIAQHENAFVNVNVNERMRLFMNDIHAQEPSTATPVEVA